MGYLEAMFTEAHKDLETGEFPLSLGVEVTNHCNLRCPMCPRETAARGFDNMDMALFRKIADEAAGRDRVVFLPQGFGESFIHPRFNEMLLYCRDVGVKLTMLITNGTYLNEKNIHALVDAQVPFVNVSLDGTVKEVYEKIRVNAELEKVVANVKDLFRIRKERGSALPYVILRMIKMDDTIADMEAFQDHWEPFLEEHDEIAFSNYQTWSNSVDDHRVGPPEGLTEGAEIEKREGKRPPCRMLYKTMQVFHDGSTTLCCYDYDCSMNVGNAREESISEMWLGSRAQHFRRLHEEGRMDEIPICKGCQEYTP